MEAMILAAGLGTRLRPLTDDRPKALVEVGGTAMLARVARRLVAAGADHLVINVHPFAERVQASVEAHEGFGAQVSLSHERETNLETGGGLRHAAPLFRTGAPFLLHNVDVLTDLDLRALYDAHAPTALATLAVRPAQSERYLIFDADEQLCGYARRADGEEVFVQEPAGTPQRLDFLGVQVIAPRIFDLFEADGVFSIINAYLRLAQAGERLTFHRASPDCTWIDIGTHKRLAAAERHLRQIENGG